MHPDIGYTLNALAVNRLQAGDCGLKTEEFLMRAVHIFRVSEGQYTGIGSCSSPQTEFGGMRDNCDGGICGGKSVYNSGQSYVRNSVTSAGYGSSSYDSIDNGSNNGDTSKCHTGDNSDYDGADVEGCDSMFLHIHLRHKSKRNSGDHSVLSSLVQSQS